MSVSEFQRHQIFQWFEEQMGPERAASMMQLLPPVGWGDIATGTELRAVETSLRGEIARLDGKIDRLDGKIDKLSGTLAHGLARQSLRTYVTMLASNATIAGLVLAAVRLG